MLVSTSAGALLQQFENYQPPAEKWLDRAAT